MTNSSLIGCGRGGTFLGWYSVNKASFDKVDMYDIPTSPNFLELKETRKNAYLSMTDNMILHENIEDVLKNDFVIISIGCQHFRSLCKQLNGYDIAGKTFLLAMKGLEESSAKTMFEIMKEEVTQPVHIAVLAGPGHVQRVAGGESGEDEDPEADLAGDDGGDHGVLLVSAPCLTQLC